jgi:hypothetical protein
LQEEAAARGYDEVGTKYNTVAPPESTLNPLTEEEKFRLKPNKPGQEFTVGWGPKLTTTGTAANGGDADTSGDTASSAAPAPAPATSKKRSALALPAATVNVTGLRPPQLRRPNVSTEDHE